MKDYFSGENSKPQKDWFSFKTIGDKITGIYIGKVKNDVVDNWGHKNMEYIFETTEGYKFVSGRNYRKEENGNPDAYRILYPMLGVKPGTVMGLKYTEDRPSTRGNPMKIVDAIYPDKPSEDLEALKKFDDELGFFYNLNAEAQLEVEAEGDDEIKPGEDFDLPKTEVKEKK